MSWLPVAERELRLSARRRRTYWGRFGAGLVCTALTLALLSPAFQGLAPPSGQRLFQLLAVLGMAFAVWTGVFLTADALSEERRAGTLGLLFLTDLGSFDVVLGKLAARALTPLYGVLVIFPFMALTILLGGVTGGEFGRICLVLICTLFSSLALGLFVSAFSTDGRKSMLGTFGLLLAWGALPALALFWGTTSFAALSPAYGFYAAFDIPYRSLSSQFWMSIVISQAVGWLGLAGAGWLASRWVDEEFASAPKVTPKAVRHRRHYLEENPALWLARRESGMRKFFWLALIMLGGLWLMGYLAVGLRLIPGGLWPVVVGASVLHGLIKIWVAWEVTHRVCGDRQGGELELLLVTGLDVPQLVEGKLAVLKRQFLWPAGLIVAVELGLIFAGAPAWDGSESLALLYIVGLGLFVTDSYTLCWFGLWQGVSARGGGTAFSRTLLCVLVLPVVLFAFFAPAAAILFGGNPSSGMLVLIWFGVGYFLDLALTVYAMNACLDHFREAASRHV